MLVCGTGKSWRWGRPRSRSHVCLTEGCLNRHHSLLWASPALPFLKDCCCRRPQRSHGLWVSWAPVLEGSEVHGLTVGPPLSALVPEAAFAWELPPEGQVFHCVPHPSFLSLRVFVCCVVSGQCPLGSPCGAQT